MEARISPANEPRMNCFPSRTSRTKNLIRSIEFCKSLASSSIVFSFRSGLAGPMEENLARRLSIQGWQMALAVGLSNDLPVGVANGGKTILGTPGALGRT